ncbi:unnamed protein product [Notodromas monacha]|uniref:TAFH domain-containing protein n=1 Tax=Notodromas monacha TaxID=399045 RepID=A0A7R9BDV2_9CRUS|nr:unnamed protein product [Notodromas monacha]CAG0912421.1 unnamed protein product [Notodromas monacha]
MASNKFIEDALTKQVSESAVNAIVGSLESHIAAADDARAVPTLEVRPTVNATRGNSPLPRGTIVQTVQIPQSNVQAVVMPSPSFRARGITTTAVLPAGTTIPGTQNAGVPRAIAQLPSSAVLIGTNAQVRSSQQTVVQTSGVPIAGPAGNQFLVRTEGGYQIIRLAVSPATTVASSPVAIPQYRFSQSRNPNPVLHQTPVQVSAGQQLVRPSPRSPTRIAIVTPQPAVSVPPPLLQHRSAATAAATRPTAANPVVVQQQQQQQQSASSQSLQMPPETAKIKCKNFLATLLRLANEQPDNVAKNVRNLIQGLVDGKVIPEDFTSKLQRELNSSPQPCLVPFLKKSLPFLRHSLATGELTIDGVVAPPLSSITLPTAAGTATAAAMTTQNSTASATPRPGSRIVPQRMPPPRPPAPPATQVQMQTPNRPETFNAQYTGGLKIITPTPLQSPGSHFVSGGGGATSVGGGSGGHSTTSPSKMKAKPKANGVPSPVQNVRTMPSTGMNGISPMHRQKVSPATAAAGAGAAAAGGSKVDRKGAVNASGPVAAVRSDVDDINDVAAMGGVNLLEESQRILGSTEFIGTLARSCSDQMALNADALASKVDEVCRRKGLDSGSVQSDVLMLLSHAAEEVVKTQLSKLSHAAQHRMDIFKFNPQFEQCNDVRGQIRFLENVEKGEKRRHEEQEREMLFRAVKSRAKVEDPERAKLREKAKELQRAEQEEIRQREANLTALQAIGTRKKARTDAPVASAAPAVSSMMFRPRVKRVNLRDLAFIWEGDRDRCRGRDLYKLFLK